MSIVCKENVMIVAVAGPGFYADKLVFCEALANELHFDFKKVSVLNHVSPEDFQRLRNDGNSFFKVQEQFLAGIEEELEGIYKDTVIDYCPLDVFVSTLLNSNSVVGHRQKDEILLGFEKRLQQIQDKCRALMEEYIDVTVHFPPAQNGKIFEGTLKIAALVTEGAISAFNLKAISVPRQREGAADLAPLIARKISGCTSDPWISMDTEDTTLN